MLLLKRSILSSTRGDAYNLWYHYCIQFHFGSTYSRSLTFLEGNTTKDAHSVRAGISSLLISIPITLYFQKSIPVYPTRYKANSIGHLLTDSSPIWCFSVLLLSSGPMEMAWDSLNIVDLLCQNEVCFFATCPYSDQLPSGTRSSAGLTSSYQLIFVSIYSCPF